MRPLSRTLAHGGAALAAVCAAILSGTPAHAGPAASPHPVGGYIPSTQRISAAQGHVLSIHAVPVSVDLRPKAPEVGDQGPIGSCVAWTIAHSLMGYYANTSTATGAPYAPLYLYMRVVSPGGAPNAGLVPEWALNEAQTHGVDTQADYTQGTWGWQTPPTNAEISNATKYKITGWTTLF